MTRSIGDLELKPFGVTAVPDVRKIKVYVLNYELDCNFKCCFNILAWHEIR